MKAGEVYRISIKTDSGILAEPFQITNVLPDDKYQVSQLYGSLSGIIGPYSDIEDMVLLVSPMTIMDSFGQTLIINQLEFDNPAISTLQTYYPSGIPAQYPIFREEIKEVLA